MLRSAEECGRASHAHITRAQRSGFRQSNVLPRRYRNCFLEYVSNYASDLFKENCSRFYATAPVDGRNYNMDFYDPVNGWHEHPTTHQSTFLGWVNLTTILEENTVFRHDRPRYIIRTTIMMLQEAADLGYA